MKTETSTSSTPSHQKTFWLWVMCLTGVDYFSTLGYQPSIAYEATGLLAPLATVLLVFLTLFGALPVYSFVAGESPHGQGSIGMLERLVRGWGGKALVLALLGFAATDFVITKTLSSADAATHVISNPIWPREILPVSLNQQQIALTMLMLIVLGAMFLKGFREVISLAVIIVAVYLFLNAIIIGLSLNYIVHHTELWEQWKQAVFHGTPSDWHISAEHKSISRSSGGWFTIALFCLLGFPKLALGLSGFETGVAVMPLVRGRPEDLADRPRGRIRNTRKLLFTAAAIMSCYLMGSSICVSLLIEPRYFELAAEATGSTARERALAFIAHGEGGCDQISGLFGPTFGTIYDISTVVILWFAGASAMAGLLNLIPRYLPRYGMAPSWARATRPLVVLFTVINLIVTWLFEADPGAQAGAYATGVLVLMSSGCVATVIEKWRSAGDRPTWRRVPWGYVAVTGLFVYTTIDVIIEKPDGLKIASWFIVTIIVTSLLSRSMRATELRFVGFQFKDENSRFLWDSIRDAQFDVLVPHRPGQRSLDDKEKAIRREHRLGPEIQLAFIEVELYDPSEFEQQPVMEVIQEESKVIIRITRAASIAHTIAALALELSKAGKPPEIHFGWSERGVVAGMLGFLLLGEGNVPWMVQQLLTKAQPDPDKRPMVIIGGR
jgi:hypothetical protein